MSQETVAERSTKRRIYERLAEVVCRRAFSSPEALAYELTIAPSLAKIVAPEFLARIDGTLILDVGCGGGIIAALLSEKLRAMVIGVDPSKSQMRRVKRQTNRGHRIHGVQGYAASLPFVDNSFDGVVSSCAFKHWPDPSEGIAECLRVVRPGGRIVIVEIDGASSPGEFWSFAKKSRVPIGMRNAYVRFAMRTVVGVAPTHDELTEAVARCSEDFTVAHIDGSPFHVVTIKSSE